jgi:bifunctional oligoribonuclease and PAP phosphatase NrnA
LKATANQIKKIFQDTQEVTIVSHENPDGDAIGSAIAMANFLKRSGKLVHIWMPGRFPSYYRWMKGADKIKFYSENQIDIIEDLKNSDTLIAVDISTFGRTGKMAESLRSFQGKRILIDHHIHPETKEFDQLFSDTTVSSTCELIYHLISLIGASDLIDIHTAEALYVGIMTDTGSFSFNCNSPVTYEVTAKLVHLGISPDRIHKLVYDNNKENRIRLLGYALQKMKVIPEYHTAYISLGKDELETRSSQAGDTEGIVNFALSIRHIVLAAFFSVRDGEVKISFRSKGRFSVNDFAQKHFNGGGHFNAAGGSFTGTIDDAVTMFESLLPTYQSELQKHNEGY